MTKLATTSFKFYIWALLIFALSFAQKINSISLMFFLILNISNMLIYWSWSQKIFFEQIYSLFSEKSCEKNYLQ